MIFQIIIADVVGVALAAPYSIVHGLGSWGAWWYIKTHKAFQLHCSKVV